MLCPAHIRPHSGCNLTSIQITAKIQQTPQDLLPPAACGSRNAGVHNDRDKNPPHPSGVSEEPVENTSGTQHLATHPMYTPFRFKQPLQRSPVERGVNAGMVWGLDHKYMHACYARRNHLRIKNPPYVTQTQLLV